MNIRNLTPGGGWTRPYPDPGIYEDQRGNRCKPVTGGNWIAISAKGSASRLILDTDEPLRSAILRNQSMRRAGLAAARVIFAGAEP